MPDEFIKIAEQSGLIVDVDERIITLACKAARDWVDDYPELFVAVNASAAHIARIDDIALVRSALDESGLPAKNLKVEITETAIMENGDKGAELLMGLRDIGVSVVIDDFGTGYSSLSHLQRLPVEELKIDRAFISAMIRSEKAAEIVRAILAMSKTFHMHVTAEGVETQEQAERLARLGVDYAQGWFYGAAVGGDMAGRLLRTRLKSSLKI
jgi:EAL domain-containing protein (putative c-di-GMP-specific phosphodiesterase class I)